MKIRIGFLHKKNKIRVGFKGNFDILNESGTVIGEIRSGTKIEAEILTSEPAEYEWYEKIETVFDINKLESRRQKYNIDQIPTRVVKAGKQIGETDNFEYWILKKTSDMEGKIYPSGDYKYKKLIKKESSGIIKVSGKEYSKRVRLVPKDIKNSFLVEGVDVGIGFHWDHSETLEYGGELEIFIDNSGSLTAVNIIDLEDYLSSVNSSEMRNDNNIEMLKAQTVAARSTVLATMGKHHFEEGFDLCSDDHCQCYQGIGKMSELSVQVAESTRGEALVFDNTIADARYSKICGGITERYSSCWEDMDFPYLASFCDNKDSEPVPEVPGENFVEDLIKDKDFDCFCNTYKYSLPESLAFCRDLFRWEERISTEETGENLKTKFGQDIGKVTDIKILRRGYSGRAIELEISGSSGKTVVSKELNIRRLLSKTHLPSSAFLIEKNGEEFILTGAGWGHGAGMCQIGAQIMGEKGFSYKDILKHYYKHTTLKKIL
jgi:SpoIID/LytB domain protein